MDRGSIPAPVSSILRTDVYLQRWTTTRMMSSDKEHETGKDSDFLENYTRPGYENGGESLQAFNPPYRMFVIFFPLLHTDLYIHL